MTHLGEVTRCTDDEIEFWTIVKLDTLNRFIGKKTNTAYTKYKKTWKWVIEVLVPLREDKKKFEARITVKSYRIRLLDKINLYGGAKCIEDRMADRGWIYNDSPKWCDIEVTQERVKTKEEEKTVVFVKILP